MTVAEPVTSTRPPDAIVVGAGLAGLVATYELVQAGRSVLVIDQENRHNLGGQTFWSLGGLFLVDSPEQRRTGDQGGKDLKLLLRERISGGATGPVEAFKQHGADFVVSPTLRDLVAGMNAIARGPELPYDQVKREIVARDREVGNRYSKDMQIMAINNARAYRPDGLTRIAKPHRLLDPKHGPLIAVRLNILTRKTLGGLETNLDSQVMRPDGAPFEGLYAAGEVAGFGGGGVHGYNALEGTFLGGCIFSGRAAGRAIARQVGASARERVSRG